MVALVLAACGSAPKKAEDAPKGTSPKYYSDDGPPTSVPDNLASIPDAVPIDEPFHRFANRPYVVFGRSYVPAVNKDAYRERGVASWYGKKFHGQKTSSGEVYDMFAMTAAHKTLPIPSYAKVTNVRTGASVVVRVNDRGPFHGDRIIDLSYAAASRIGIASAGSGLVEVERVFGGQAVVASASPVATPVNSAPVATALAPTPPIMAIATTIETPVVSSDAGSLYLQLGAFSAAENAELFRNRMQGELGWNLEPIDIAQRDGLHRVRLGPYRNRDEALAIAEKVRSTLGYSPALTNR
ncbi:Endolytic peptidoglycan transglycosylase RlpA [Usitatibacter rugosus]|uniref:Endolytic peptidoglycan transglycosylase RlpA n=1 Tax=Usitatibacter rugosus TaxID=2732067 RepID=A0A6M4H138_9PROT|nr:septal ring lytic transglycosylase RlpA family protein [Usitatibacter rugosus]QJR13062.1 Endolytic peptidoglycan transglycosylase RlpA [Usitatibacter rugosus]